MLDSTTNAIATVESVLSGSDVDLDVTGFSSAGRGDCFFTSVLFWGFLYDDVDLLGEVEVVSNISFSCLFVGTDLCSAASG
jgi:hypothetical protein